jgi:hypothetical protein
MTLQFIIAMIASAINERMQQKLAYAQVEVQVLKEVLKAATGSAATGWSSPQTSGVAWPWRAKP